MMYINIIKFLRITRFLIFFDNQYIKKFEKTYTFFSNSTFLSETLLIFPEVDYK
jgi:hypothetical protein